MKRLLIFLVCSMLSLVCFAYESPEDLIESGLDAYRRGDTVAAFKSWTRDSGMEQQQGDLKKQAEALSRINEFYGKYEGYDIVKDHRLTKRSRMILLAINFEKGIIFSRFQVYRQASGEWVLNEFKFHTESSRVWPTYQVFGSDF